MKVYDIRHPVFVLGLYETGLGVGRALGRSGIRVIGIDFKEDIGFRSKYIEPFLCPHPLNDIDRFSKYMIDLARGFSRRPIIMPTTDEFVLATSRLRKHLKPHFLFNLPSEYLLEQLMDKGKLYDMLKGSSIHMPHTVVPCSLSDLNTASGHIRFPVFIKPCRSYKWRQYFGGTKGFYVRDRNELIDKFRIALDRHIRVVVQEVVEGPDTNNFKFCCYIAREGRFLLAFMLQKVRQQPVGFGIGSAVRSIYSDQLAQLGKHLFHSIGYSGVGSAEFKLDMVDRVLKLIEINPRYWQQNSLAERCGMNFPLMNYLEVTNQQCVHIKNYLDDVKWVNIIMDFNSFLVMRQRKELSFWGWISSLRGNRVVSDFSWDDRALGVVLTKCKYLMPRVAKYLLRKSHVI